MCAEYLKRVANDLDEGVANLVEASMSYSRGAALMKQFVNLFPFPGGGPLNEKDCRQGAEILRSVRREEERVVEDIEKALGH
jgi:hypothetical protein